MKNYEWKDVLDEISIIMFLSIILKNTLNLDRLKIGDFFSIIYLSRNKIYSLMILYLPTYFTI